MKLLHWGTVRPEGQSNIAALRFTAPLRITLIRVFASESQPFSNLPDIVAQTEPDAFYLDVYFNAIPGPSVGPVDKDKRNVLVPTSIVYTGGMADFPMDMGVDYSTRLMIIKGAFQALSFALYGEIMSQPPPLPNVYAPIALPSFEPLHLSKALDPANAADPTILASNLLKMIPEAPPLHLVIRLMYCLKPMDDDWEDPDFPNHGTALEIPEDFDLEMAADLILRPVRKETTEDAISTFAKRVSDLIGPKSITQSDNVAKLFCASASQIPSLGLALCLHIDPEGVFDEPSLDDGVLAYLLDAAANADLARHCSSDDLIGILTQCFEHPASDKATKTASRRLIDRIHGWTSFENALSNEGDEYSECIAMIKDIGTEEKSLGIWLESMILHQDLVSKLSEQPVPSFPKRPLDSSTFDHDSFIAYIRAFIGVATVFVVWAWADSVGNDECRERALGIIRLWQGVEGYREITNHLLPLRQFSRRLMWITTRDYDDDPPRKSGCIGEQIILELAKNPQAMDHDLFRETVISLKPPTSFLTETDRTRLRKSAFVADDGLDAALEEIFFESDHPELSLRRLHILRIALEVAGRELLEDEESELGVVRAAWDRFSSGLIPRFIGLLGDVARDLNAFFSLDVMPPPPVDKDLTEQLFFTAHDILHLLIPLTIAFPLIPRSIRDLVNTMVDLFSLADLTMSTFAPPNVLHSASQTVHQDCLDLLHQISRSKPSTATGKRPCHVVLLELLENGARLRDCDPVHHIEQILVLFDHVLPDEEDTAEWVSAILPSLLNPIKAFFSILDVEKKVHVMDRLIHLDDGVIGIAEWLLVEELKVLSSTLAFIRTSSPDAPHTLALKSQADMILQFIALLVQASSIWFFATYKDVPDIHLNLKSAMTTFIDGRFTSRHFSRLVGELAMAVDTTNYGDLITDLAIGYLQRINGTVFMRVWDPVIMRRLLIWSASSDSAALRQEMGRGLWGVAKMEEQPGVDLVECAFIIVEWLLTHKNPALPELSGVSVGESMKIEQFLEDVVMPDQRHLVKGFKNLAVDEDEVILPDSINLDVQVEIAVKDIPDLFHPEDIPAPSTPKGTVTPDVLGSVIVSPPNALLYSPLASTLTKNYANNDFRDLRQASASRQNTSRLPSMHVDVGINGHST